MGFATRAISDLGFCLPRRDNWQAWILNEPFSREGKDTPPAGWEIITTRNNGCYLLRPHRPRDRRPQGGRPPHLRARGRLRPPHPVRLLRQGFRPPRVRIPVIPSRGFRAEFFPWFIGRTSDRRARVLAHRAPAPTGFDAAASQEPFVDDIERALAPGRVSRGARPGGAVARDSRSLGLRACPPVDRAQGATGGGCWRGRTRLIAARRSVIPNISSVPLAPFLRVARAPDRPRRARPPRA